MRSAEAVHNTGGITPSIMRRTPNRDRPSSNTALIFELDGFELDRIARAGAGCLVARGHGRETDRDQAFVSAEYQALVYSGGMPKRTSCARNASCLSSTSGRQAAPLPRTTASVPMKLTER